MRVERTNLKNIVVPFGIVSGYSFRGKIQHSAKGNLRVVQLKDMENNYSQIGDNCVRLERGGIGDKYLLERGDILFISKGANNFAIVYRPKNSIPTVASSVFYVIKVDDSKADPGYVAWYVNSKEVQQYFQANATGTYSPSINREVVEEISLKLPSLEDQRRIANVARLAQKEQNIYTALKEKRNQLIEAQLLQVIN